MNTTKFSSNTKPGISRIRFPTPDLIVLAGYLLLTILMTWPTALHLTDAIPGDGFDGWQNYWNLWWVKEALLVEATNPYFTDYLYPPAGTNLLFHTLNIYNGLWTLPIQLNVGLALAYNSIVFVSFVLAGYGGYLLSLYTLTRFKLANGQGAPLAAFVGGLIFTMSPFHLAHLLGHMQVFTMIWPPFYVLWLLRTLKPGGIPPTRYRRRDIALTCLFLILATLVDWYHTLYLLIFTGLVLLWTLWQAFAEQRKKSPPAPPPPCSPAQMMLRPVLVVLTIGVGFAVLLSPLLAPMLREAGDRPDLETGLVQNITLSADLLAFFLPSEMHPLWGEWAKGIADNFSTTTSERLIFVGFVPLALSLFIAIRAWRSSIVRFWSLVVITFFVLALGPFLHIGGHLLSLGEWPIPLPYLLLYRTIPFLDLTRSLSRYALMVMLGLGVLAALALAHIQLLIPNPQSPEGSSLSRHRFQDTAHRLAVARLIPLLAILLICFEFLPVPYPVSKIEVPRFYFDLRAAPDDYTIAELPMDWDRPTPLLHQVIHGKRLLTAYTSRNNPRELAWRTPVFQHWRYLSPDIIAQPLAEIAPTIFYDFNLRYIVLDYWQMPPGPVRQATERWVAAALPQATPVYDDGRLKVYQTPPRQETEPYLTLGHGWSDREETEAGELRRSFRATADEQPALFLHHPQEQPLTLAITASAAVPQHLTVYADGEPVGQLAITEEFSTHRLALPPLTNRIVKLRFRSDHPASEVVISRVGLQKQ